MSCVALETIENATFNGFCKRLRPKSDVILPEYAAYYFRTDYFRRQCMAMASLITRASLNEKMIKHLTIRYPKDKKYQSIISSFLMNYDELIKINEDKINNICSTIEELYKEWFSRFRFPNYDKYEFDGSIPKNWEIASLGDNKYSKILSSGIKKFDDSKIYIPTANDELVPKPDLAGRSDSYVSLISCISNILIAFLIAGC